MSALDLDAIEARWSVYGGMGNTRSADDYTDAGCRIFAEHGFRDVPALVAALRDRDNTITRVLELLDPNRRGLSTNGGFTVAAYAISAALDPQETQ